MPSYLRNSLAAKLTACGFILQILVGQFWLAKFLFAQAPSDWMVYLSGLGLVLTGIGALGLGYLVVKEKIYGS